MIRAALFDMDGVLFDTERLGKKIFLDYCHTHGYPQVDDALYHRTMGIPGAVGKHIYFEALGDDFPYDTVHQVYRDGLMQTCHERGLPRKDGLMECMNGLKVRGVKIALVTSTVRPQVEEYFRCMPDIGAVFDAKICGGEVPNGKPAPDMFLAAAKALDLPASECVGVEDSFSGVNAIHASGAFCVMIPDLLPFSDRFAPFVDECLPSLRELCPLIDRLNAC